MSALSERRFVARWPARRILLHAAWTCGALLTSASQAHAYLDPGTGGILLQVILGALAAGTAVLVSLRERVGAFLAGLRTHKNTSTAKKDTTKS